MWQNLIVDYKVWSGYFGPFMYMCVVVHCAEHRGISTTGDFIVTRTRSTWCKRVFFVLLASQRLIMPLQVEKQLILHGTLTH